MASQRSEDIHVSGVIGADVPRVDGRAKVTGRALYGDDQPVGGALFGYLVASTIARGRIVDIDERAARAVRGVLEIFTWRNVGRAVAGGKTMPNSGHMASSLAPLRSDRIRFAGQVVAMVVADSYEAARAAAALVQVRYESEPPAATFDCRDAREVKPTTVGESELSAGDFARAYAAAAVTVDEEYETPAQHHNPIELYQTTCSWDGDTLTVWESTQSVRGAQHGLADQLGMRPKHVRVISPFIGGAFGSRGELAQSTALVALAAQRLGRPVRLVATRKQGFTLRTFRAETKHRLRFGADRDGRLVALGHHGWELCSRDDRFAVAGIESSTRAYGCPNIDAKVMNVEADRQSPGFMRAPPETPYLFALESAMDELAYKLAMDPVELRRRNDTRYESIKGLPFSSRSLVECYDIAGEAFGWRARDPAPRSMRDGDWLVGWGCATAIYPTKLGPASCRLTLDVDGRVTVEVGSHDIGTGMYTIAAQTAADQLGVPLERVTVRLGDSDLPPAPLSAGSTSAATVCTVVAKACDEMRRELGRAAAKTKEGPLHGADLAELRMRDDQLVGPRGAEPLTQSVRRVGRGAPVVVEATNVPDGAPPLISPTLVGHGMAVLSGGASLKDRAQFAFGAHFVELRVHRETGEIRVPRVVGAFAGGRIMNPRTARSQLMGGQIWGISAALFEATHIDPRSARYVNDDLAEYLIPVNADIVQVTTLLVPEEDRLVNPLGIKGVGELGVVGMNAAVANAVYHATGVRVRKLPIRIEALLGSLA